MDMDKIYGTCKKPLVKGILIALLILSVMTVAYQYRVQANNLPAMNTYATKQVLGFYQSQLQQQVAQKYAYLPAAQQTSLVNQQLQQYVSQNKAQIDSEIATVADSLKSHYKGPDNTTYLLGIDPYLQYYYAQNYLKTGTAGDKIINGQPYVTQRNGRLGQSAGFRLIPFIAAEWDKLVNLFYPGTPLMRSMFFYPAILSMLAMIPAFFLGRRLSGGSLGGFTAAMLLAVAQSVIFRTSAGFYDNDQYNFIMPLLILWLLVEAWHADSPWKTKLYAALSGLSIAVYMFLWTGFWYTNLFIIGAILGYVVYLAVRHFALHKKMEGFFAGKDMRHVLSVLGSYFLSSVVFIAFIGFLIPDQTAFGVLKDYFASYVAPFWFIQYQAVGVTTIWPNVLTTVAELGTGNVASVVAASGGTLLYLFAFLGIAASYLTFKKEATRIEYWFAGIVAAWYGILLFFTMTKSTNGLIAGVQHMVLGSTFVYLFLLMLPLLAAFVLTYIRKDYHADLFFPLLITIFFAGTLYAAMNGTRFTALHILYVAMAIGIAAEKLLELSGMLGGPLNIDPRLLKIAGVIVLLFLILYVPAPMVQGWNQATNLVPSFNDAWYNTLSVIKADPNNAIITSWWDFGHWFYSMTGKSVTFDGGDQGNRIHWVGEVLLTNNETKAVDILRMLNCGQNQAYNVLYNATNNNSYRAVTIVQKIIYQSRSQAAATLAADNISKATADQVLNYTHCTDLYDQFFIASQDMIGKAPVWAHFGIWNFTRADIYNKVDNSANKQVGVNILMQQYNYTLPDAETTYDAIKNTSGDQWIAPWPGYLGSPASCTGSGDLLTCSNGILVNMTTMTAYALTTNGMLYPQVFTYEKNGTVEKKVMASRLLTPATGAILYQDQGSYMLQMSDPDLADSIFTRMFFFQGAGLKYFKLLKHTTAVDGTNIYLYKLDWNETLSWWDH